jgi:nuclease S1
MRISTIAAAGVLWLFGCGEAAAWGCEGHRAVVYIAERLLPPSTVAAARAVLTASPADPALRRFCDPVPDDRLVDDALWADDYRAVDGSTFGWHFINVPRQVALTTSNEHIYCSGGNCVVDAIAAQYRALTTTVDATTKANALRYLLHLVGDVHQPLHATTNGDRGGNCVALTYYDRPPQESQTTPNDFSPNLHGVWDTSTIRTLMTARGLADARALAGYVASQHALPATVGGRAATKDVATGWARGSHEAGRTVTYPRLPVQIALEPASALTLSSCADNHDIVHRMLAKHIVIDGAYQQASIRVIVDQLRLAGIRLAATLRAAFP